MDSAHAPRQRIFPRHPATTRYIAGMRVLILSILSGIFLSSCSRTDTGLERHVSDMTANDLAEATGVHWWIVRLPEPSTPKDMVGIEVISSDGKVLTGGGGMGGEFSWGGELRVYCYEESALNRMTVAYKAKNGGLAVERFDDYFKGAATSGASNGTVLNVGDILLKFDNTKSPSFTGGNVMYPGQVGIRVAINRRK